MPCSAGSVATASTSAFIGHGPRLRAAAKASVTSYTSGVLPGRPRLADVLRDEHREVVGQRPADGGAQARQNPVEGRLEAFRADGRDQLLQIDELPLAIARFDDAVRVEEQPVAGTQRAGDRRRRRTEP